MKQSLPREPPSGGNGGFEQDLIAQSFEALDVVASQALEIKALNNGAAELSVSRASSMVGA